MKVPEYTRQVSDGGPERVRRSPLDSGSAMSAVAAEGRGAQGVAGALGDLSGVFGKIAADADEAKIMAAANDYMTKSTSLLYDSEKGLLNAQGAGAEGLSERSAMAHKSFADDIASKLTARQRKHFYETVANYDRSAGRSVMAHENKALSDYRTGEAKKLLANTAVTFSKSPNELSMEAQEDLIRSITLGMFGDQGEEGNIKNSDLIRSALIQQTIANIAVNDPMAAETFFEKHKSLMEPAAAEEVKNTLEKAALPIKIQGETPKLFAEFGLDGLSGALASIRENYSGAEETARISAAHSLWIEKAQERNNYEAKVYDDVYGIIRGNGSYDAVTRAISSVKWSTNAIKYQLLDLRDRKFRMGAYAEGGSGDGRVKTDRETLLNIWSMVDDKSIVQKYPTFGDFSNKFASKLSTTDLKAFRSMYEQAAGGGLAINPIKLSEASTLQDILKKSGIKDELLIGAIFDRYNEEIAYRIAHPKDYKEPLTNERRIEIMKDLVADKVVGKGKYWFSDDPVVKGYQIPVGFKEDAGKPNSYTRINPETGNTEVYVSPYQNKKPVGGSSAEGTRVIR